MKVRRNTTTARTSFISSLKQSLCGVHHHEELLVHDMDVADKSVATDDLIYAVEDHNTRLEVARLEAVLNTLVEQKVDAMKNGGNSKFIKAMAAASPKTIARRLRIASLSTSIADRDENSRYFKRKRRRHRLRQCSAERSFEDDGGHQHLHKGGGGGGVRVSRSPESARCNLERMPAGAAVTSVSPPIAVLHPTIRTSADEVYLQFDPASGSCCCVDHAASPDPRIPVSCDEDYVSLKIDECEEIDFEEEDEYEARRRRRKRKKRRRKRRKLRAMAAVAIVEEVRAIDPDELPPKARWTIMATAGLLLLMCLMLVGVTLRMAPLIDDMVRKENEALMYSLHGNKTMPTAATVVPAL